MTEALDLDIRRKMYKIISSNPGVNLSTIAAELGVSIPLADYHLYYLEQQEVIAASKLEGYKRYYLRGEHGVEDTRILSLLQQETLLKIVLFLLAHPQSKPKDIRESIQVSPALLTYYLKKLIKAELIAVLPSEEKNKYVVLKEKQIVALLVKYKENMLLKRFRDTWVQIIPLSSKVPEKK